MRQAMAKAESFLGKVTVIWGGLALLVGAVTWFGFQITTPQDMITRVEMKMDKMQAVQEELRNEVQELKQLQEASLRGDCLDHPKEDLARLGLLPKCKALGIER